MMNLRTVCMSAAVASVALVSQSQAAVVFDDYVPGVSWNVDWGSLNTINVKSGTQSIQAAGNTQIVFLPPAGPSLIGSAPVLDFYVNTVTAGSISLEIKITTPIKTVEYHWGGGDTYDVDGAPQVGALSTDGDTSTWQHVKFDVTQPYDFWGATGTEWTSLTPADTVTKIQISGSANTLVDAVQFAAVPEPTTLGLLGTAALLTLRRRRA